MMKIVSHASTLPKTYLTWKEGKVMVFCKPAQERRVGLLLCIAHVLMYIVLPLVGAILTGKLAGYWFGILGAGLVLFSFYIFAGPDDIRLDGDQRTYERTTGWPWKPATQQGSFEDIKGIYVSLNGQAMLLMNKRVFPYKGVVLSSSGTKGTADALAEDLSCEFGFPIVPCPS